MPDSSTKFHRSEMLFVPVAVPVIVRAIDRLRGGDTFEADVRCSDHSARSADGTRIHYSICGEGDRVVFFVHGWTCNSTIFRYQQECFSPEYKIVSLDLRGHGMSGVPESLDYHPDRLAEDLKCVIDAVGPAEFVIAGHSLGGFTTFKFFEHYAEEYKGALKGLAIIDSTGTDLVDGIVMGEVVSRVYPRPLAALMKAVGRNSRFSETLLRLFSETSTAYLVVRLAAFGRKPHCDQVEKMTDMIFSTPMSSVSLAAKACLDFHFEYFLENVDLPVIVMVGDRDKLTNIEVNVRTAELLPDARLVVFEGAGHCAMMEQHDGFNDELGEFLHQVLPLGKPTGPATKKPAKKKARPKKAVGG
jgi:pimeloyl-ACP methyl ester carboxylesterase